MTPQEPVSRPYVSSSLGTSPKSSRKRLDSDAISKMRDRDSGADDQIRLAELATARLERQSKRITENDPTIPMSKLVHPRTARTKVSKHWPDPDYPESSDGDVASTSRVSRKGSPFDVHAKVFRPGSRDSSVSRSFEAHRKDSVTLSADDGDFQLVTSKRTKPSSRPAVGLNAREVKPDDKSTAIVVSFNRQEINEVFGNDLPPLAYFQGNVGNKDGQVGFAMHPNGDISAQQWSQSDYQWFNIGQFSNSRRRTEGTLASHRLKGENELHSLLQHSLCYFRAVAKQHEASSMKLPFGPKELQAYMPKVSINRPVRKVAAPPITEDPTKSDSEQPIPEKKQQIRTTSVGPEIEPWAQGYTSRVRSRRELSSTPVALPSSNLSVQHDFIPSTTNAAAMPNGAPNRWPYSLTALNNLSFGAFSANRDHDSPNNSSLPLGLTEPATTRADVVERSQYLKSFLPKSVSQTATSQLHSSVPHLKLSTFFEKTQPQTDSSEPTSTSSRRSFTKACLDKIFDAATSRNMSSNTATRTVLHDPFQSQSATTSSMTKQESEVKHYKSAWSSIPIGESASCRIIEPSSSTSNDDLVFDPRVSEPEFASKTKMMEIVDISLPHMTTEELAIYSRPSPQTFNGPFFMGSPDVPNEADRKSHEQELHDWFYGGLKIIERQDEHFEYIKTAHNQTPGITQAKVNPRPIGTPFTSSRSNKKPEPFNEVTTRLFLTVHESLSQYTQGPLEQRRGYLAPFCDPPEWCIDKSANGNNSFFGEDWSQPPERISRDSRYRPLPFESKFGAYDGHRSVGAGSIRPSIGRLRFGSGLQY